jgi:chromosome segregation protein
MLPRSLCSSRLKRCADACDNLSTVGYSRFYLCDLQVHTPADPQHEYGNVGGREPSAEFARRLITEHKAQGVSVIAVTDHNRVDWYPALAEAGGSAGVTVFPGLEFSVNGCHLLAIWDSNPSGYEMAKRFLVHLFGPGEQLFKNGAPRPVTKGQVKEWAQRAAEHGALVFAPHSTKKDMGLFAAGVCRNADEIAQGDLIHGFDVSGAPTADVLVNPRSKFGGRRPRWFISGDVRSLAAIGTRAVYLKLGSSPSLEGIRQAFLMPNRVRFPRQLKTTWGHVKQIEFLDNPVPSWPRLTSVRVKGGFHDGLQLDFGPGLNTLIGGSRTGKSALIEMLRHVSDAPPAPRELKAVLDATFKANAEASLRFIDADGTEYEARRAGGSSPSELMRGGQPAGVGVTRRIRVDVFGQRQLQTLSDRPNDLRSFLARAAGPEWEPAQKREAGLLEDLRKTGVIVENLQREVRRLRESAAELGDLQERLENWQLLGAETLFKRTQDLSRIDQQISKVRGWPEQADAAAESLDRISAPPRVPSDSLVPEGLGEALAPLHTKLVETSTEIRRASAAAKEALAPLLEQWKTASQAERGRIRSALADAGIQGIEDLTATHDRAARLEQDVAGQDESEKALADTERLRAQHLSSLSEARREQSRLLEAAAKRLSGLVGPRIRVTLEPFGQRSALAELLSELLAGQGARREQIQKLAARSPVEIAMAIRQGASGLEALGCTGSTTEKLASLPIESIHRLEVAPVPDLITVEVNVGQPGEDKWQPVGDISPGQRSMALLALALVNGNDPLIVDQPEDDLDNRFIYEDLVKLLADVCAHRQLIVATHNANIPILGDAELVVALDASHERSTVLAAGGLEERSVAEQARRILEGGDEAFMSRFRRYLAVPSSP